VSRVWKAIPTSVTHAHTPAQLLVDSEDAQHVVGGSRRNVGTGFQTWCHVGGKDSGEEQQ